MASVPSEMWSTAEEKNTRTTSPSVKRSVTCTTEGIATGGRGEKKLFSSFSETGV
jgi:hypothetical protein